MRYLFLPETDPLVESCFHETGPEQPTKPQSGLASRSEMFTEEQTQWTKPLRQALLRSNLFQA